MKFEINDIIVYCGAFQDIKEEKTFKILRVSPDGHYQLQSYKNIEWLNQKYVEKCYEFDKNYLRKKKLKKLENEIW
jgi:hypothetical protein